MAPLKSGDTVLVTGASGFIAVWIVAAFLRRGHPVVGTVRSQPKGEYLERLFASDPKAFPGKFRYVIAEDLEKPGAFDEAVKGVDVCVHSASPFHFDAENRALEALVNPALNGTRSVLDSVQKYGERVKRVIVISSFAAILDSSKPVPTTFTEKDWNLSSPANSAKLGNSQPPLDAYRASKTLAERAAWAYVEEHKPSWDLATINPPLVVGPAIQQCESPEKLNTSLQTLWALLNGKKTESDLVAPAGNLVDVRDVAEATYLSASHAQAGGQRFAPTVGRFTLQHFADALHGDGAAGLPSEWVQRVPRGKPGAGETVVQNLLDGSKCERELSLRYHPLAKTVVDAARSLADYEARGWKGLPSAKIIEA